MLCSLTTSGNGLTAQYQQEGPSHGSYVTYNTFTASTIDVEIYCGQLPGAVVDTNRFTNGIWTGWLVPLYGETYTITVDPGTFASYCNSDIDLGHAFVSVDGTSIINAGTVGAGFNHAGPVTGNVTLLANTAYLVSFSRSCDNEDYYLRGEWQSASQASEVIPRAALFTSITPTISSFAAVWNNDCSANGTVTFTWAATLGCLSINGGAGSQGLAGSGSVTVPWDGVTTTFTLTNTGLDYISSGVLHHQSVTAQASITTLGTVAPDVLTGHVSNWNSGANYSVGRYRVVYRLGAYKLNPNRPWGVGFNDNDAQIDGAHGFYVTDGAGNVTRGPGNLLGYTSQSAAETGNAGEYVYYDHVGGNPIGMYLYDGYYPDNVAGAPSPTFGLCGPLVATLTASSLSIDVGDSTTLTWASTNADSATDPVGGTTTSGSQAVSPTVTTAYAFDATGFSGNIEKSASITVTVNQPTAPTGGTIVGSCGGTIALTWTGATHTASYILERSADGSTGWSQIYAGSTASYTDTPPSPGVVYYYRVKSVKGSATSAPSAVGSANSILAAPTPTFTLTAKGTRVTVAWTDPGAGYGTLTVSIYRSTTSGTETLLTSGLAVTDLSYTNHGLMSGSTYYYRVSFTNTCGEGTLAVEQSATATCCDGVWTPSTAPTSTYTASGATVSTFTASASPTSTYTASPAPTTTWTASTPPTPGGWTPSDCPD